MARHGPLFPLHEPLTWKCEICSGGERIANVEFENVLDLEAHTDALVESLSGYDIFEPEPLREVQISLFQGED